VNAPQAKCVNNIKSSNKRNAVGLRLPEDGANKHQNTYN
jgi:hypothetical protein